jgi:predicted nucleotidyltransferase
LLLNIPDLGFIVPNMGMKKRAIKSVTSPVGGIADALFSKVQQRVLGVIFGNPGRSFYANELIALAACGTGAAQRELIRLEGAGLVTVTRVGKQKHYQANASTPVFDELRGLVVKTSGLGDVLRAALAPFAAQIDAAFVYGSVAKAKDTVASDIDLMIVSNSLTYADCFLAMEAATKQLGRAVNPTIYTRRELAKRLRQSNAFVTRVKQQPKLWLIGEGHGFAA